MIELPSTDELARMAAEEPEKLEELRDAMNRELIESAPERLRPKLEGILFRVDGERRRHTNPLARAMAINDLMMRQFLELNALLNPPSYDGRAPEAPINAKVFKFPSPEDQ